MRFARLRANSKCRGTRRRPGQVRIAPIWRICRAGWIPLYTLTALGLGCAAPPFVRTGAAADGSKPLDDTAPGIHALYQGSFDQRFLASARAALSLGYVSALSFDIPWKVIEPAAGQYDWHLIDQALAEAAAAHKKISFGLEVAWWAPDWVRERSASFRFRHQILGEKTSPVPWDPYYLRNLKNTIVALGQRYNANPNILFIVIAGPATYWGTETNWAMIPGSVPAEDLPVLGFSLPKYERTWEDMIDTYFRAFSATPLALALNDQIVVPNPGPHNRPEIERTIRRIRDHALAKQRQSKPGRKMWLELLGLSKGGDNHFFGPYTGPQSITAYAASVWEVRHAVHVLLQDAGFLRARHYTPEDMARTLQIGLSFGADAIEVYAGDLFDVTGRVYEPYRSAIAHANAALVDKAQQSGREK